MQPVQQNVSIQGNFPIIRYDLGKRFSGYTLKRKLTLQLGERGLTLGKYGHLRPQEVWSLQDQNLSLPGFMYGSFFAGYHIQVHLPDNPQFQVPARALKDICDRL